MLKDLAILGACLGGAYLLFGRKKEATTQTEEQTAETNRNAFTSIEETPKSGICRDSETGSTYFANAERGTKNGCRTGDSLVY